jgi:hypothetical protein
MYVAGRSVSATRGDLLLVPSAILRRIMTASSVLARAGFDVTTARPNLSTG